MNPVPGGRLVPTAEGLDLVIIRRFNAPVEDVWASITEPERTARWFGRWTGEPGPGRTIRYKMTFEGEGPESEMLIEVCEPPVHLAVRGLGDYGWRLEAHLSESGGTTELRFTHHLDGKTNVGDVGPGWEYYLDNLVATRVGGSLPAFNDYYPSQKSYYLELAAAVGGNT
ncbi:MAG: SRPBCC family protein [Gemmatimonadota bacterium]